MPVILQKWIHRADLRANPDILYLFGDNKVRQGRGGQAKEMRGEPNAVGIITKLLPSMSEDAFLTDAHFDEWHAETLQDLRPVYRQLEHGEIVIVPLDGLGSGLAQLADRAPRIDAELTRLLSGLTSVLSL